MEVSIHGSHFHHGSVGAFATRSGSSDLGKSQQRPLMLLWTSTGGAKDPAASARNGRRRQCVTRRSVGLPRSCSGFAYFLTEHLLQFLKTGQQGDPFFPLAKAAGSRYPRDGVNRFVEYEFASNYGALASVACPASSVTSAATAGRRSEPDGPPPPPRLFVSDCSRFGVRGQRRQRPATVHGHEFAASWQWFR